MADKRLKASIIIGGLIDGTLKTAITDTKSGFRQVGDAIRKAENAQKSLRTEFDKLQIAGNDISGITRRYATLKTAIDRATDATKRLRQAEAMQARLDMRAGQMRGLAGRASVGALAGVGLLAPTIHAGAEMQSEITRLRLLGTSGQDKLAAVEFGRTLKNFGTSQQENVELMRDALAVFGHLGEAKSVAPLMSRMMFANRTLYGTSQEEAAAQFQNMMRVIDVRGGTNSQAAFRDQAEHIQRAITASGNRVTATDWREVVQHGGLAAKGMSNDALFYEMLPMVQEMGGSQVGTALASAYQNLYQGKTTKRAAQNLARLGLIGDRSKVKYDKAGQTAQLNPGALLGSDLFRTSQYEWVKQVLLPQLAKKGITDRKQITDIIGSIVSNRTGANLLANMVLNQKIIDRDSKLAAKAAGIDNASTAARGTAKGQQMAFGANMSNLRTNLGETILPTYVSVLGKVNTALEKLNSFVRDHPKLTRAMMIGTVAVTGALAASVPVLLVAGAALNAYGGYAALAARREALLTAAQLKQTTATVLSEQAGRTATLGRLGRLKSLVAFTPLLEIMGAALGTLVSPVGLVVGALVGGGILIWKYWEPLKAFFTGLGTGLMDAFGPVVPVISRAWNVISTGAHMAWRWLTNLLEPIHSTRQGLIDTARAGQHFGQIVGDAIQTVFHLWKTLASYSPPVLMIDVLIKGAHLVLEAWKPVQSFLQYVGDKADVFSRWLHGDNAVNPNIPQLAGAANSSRGGDVHNHHYNITQQPGQSSEELARHIANIHKQAGRDVPLSDGAD